MTDRIPVNRPRKKSEYEISFDSKKVERAWRDLRAARLNGLVDAWDFLTRTPQLQTSLCKRMLDVLEFVTRDGVQYERWQLQLSEKDGARIWYYVDGMEVILTAIHTHHPNETK